MNVNQLTQKYGFKFSKKFGQNFIGDENLLSAIVSDADVKGDDVVIEIGAGAGTLTRQIALAAKKVIAFEIDETLRPILADSLAGTDNVQVIFADVMNYSAADIEALAGGAFKVVANLPYYITTPVLFKLMECKSLESMTVMVQKEVAQRICASSGTAEYGSLSVAVQLLSRPSITRIVKRTCFTPPPNVDSAIVRMDVCRRTDVKDFAVLEKVTRCAFAMRRKTLVNNLIGGMAMTRAQAEELLKSCNIDVMARGETLNVDDYVRLANAATCRD